jgi:hypothetical protein
MSGTKEEVIVENVAKLADTTKLVDVTDKLNSSLIKMIDGLEDGVAFLGAELPEYINQLLMWNMLESLVKCLVGVIIPILMLLMYRKLWTLSEGWEEVNSFMSRMITGMCGGSICVAVVIININLEWLQIWITPKVWLVEYATALVK